MQPVQHCDGQRRGFADIEVGGQPGVRDVGQALGHIGAVGEYQTSGRTAQALVGTHGHEVRPLVEWVRPRPACKHGAGVGGVEQHTGPHLISDGSHGRHRMRGQVETGADGDEFGLYASRQLRQPSHVDGVAVSVHGGLVDIEAVQTGGTSLLMGHMAPDRGRWNNDRVAGITGGHEGIKVGHRAGPHPDLGVVRTKHLAHQIGGDYLDLLDGFQTHLVLGPGVAK